MNLNVLFAKMTKGARVSSGEQLTSANKSAQISPSPLTVSEAELEAFQSLQSFLFVFILILAVYKRVTFIRWFAYKITVAIKNFSGIFGQKDKIFTIHIYYRLHKQRYRPVPY